MGNIQAVSEPLTRSQQQTITTTWRVCSSISLAGLTLVIICMLVLQQYQKPHQQVVFTMFCATFGIFFFGIITGDQSFWIEHPVFCIFAGFFFQLCWVANIVGVLSISVNLYRSIILLKPMELSSLKYFHFF